MRRPPPAFPRRGEDWLRTCPLFTFDRMYTAPSRKRRSAMVEKRGRKTGPDLVIIPGQGRPEPPDDMPPDEARIWREVVGSMPTNWFSAPSLLELYCRHIARGDILAQRVRTLLARPMTKANLADLRKLSALSCQETAAALAVATKLRMTPQSAKHRFTAEAEVRNTPRPRPWEDD